jgi:hypothetical protein
MALQAECAFMYVIVSIADTIEKCVNGFLLVEGKVRTCRRWKDVRIRIENRALRRWRNGRSRSTVALFFAIVCACSGCTSGGRREERGKWGGGEGMAGKERRAT